MALACFSASAAAADCCVALWTPDHVYRHAFVGNVRGNQRPPLGTALDRLLPGNEKRGPALSECATASSVWYTCGEIEHAPIQPSAPLLFLFFGFALTISTPCPAQSHKTSRTYLTCGDDGGYVSLYELNDDYVGPSSIDFRGAAPMTSTRRWRLKVHSDWTSKARGAAGKSRPHKRN